MSPRTPRRATRTALTALTALAASAAALLAGCAPAATPDAPPSRVPAGEAGSPRDPDAPGVPLPPSSHIERPGEVPAEKVSDEEAAGSLRPDEKTAKERIPEIVKRGRLIVGVDQSQFLVSYHNVLTNELAGFEVDLAREIARDIFGSPDAVEFRFLQSAGEPVEVIDGTVDLALRTMSVLPERQRQVMFSTPYLTGMKRLLVPASSPIEDIDDLAHAYVCTAEDSTALRYARGLADIRGIIVTRRWSDCLMALQQHQADAVLADDIVLSGMTAQDERNHIVGTPLTTENYGVAMARPEDGGNPELVRQVNATIERIRSDGTWSRMYEYWFGQWLAPDDPPPLHYRKED